MQLMPTSQENNSLADINIGILGGGQLARMLAIRGFQLGSEVHIFSEHSVDPAAQVTRYWHQGSLNSEAELRAFLKDVKVATFESEFMNAELLESLSTEVGTTIYPSPLLMGRIQDRLLQKELLIENKIPTSNYCKVDTVSDLEKAYEQFGSVVLKKRRFGYDGYGTFIIRKANDIDPLKEIIEKEQSGFIAEEFVKFKRELACVLVRSANGSEAELPVIESYQEQSRCLWVKGPIRPTPALSRLKQQLQRFMKTINYVGAMGFELFETNSEILINELAPRVHNTAHYSMDALSEDQFTLHMKAIMGAEITSPIAHSPGFAMYNLLGSSNREPSWSDIPSGVALHWYGKKENRPGRKMGHINTVAASPEAALSKLKQARRRFDV